MAAIVRVKRHFQDDPLEAVILNTKRRKLDKDENQNKSAIFTFTGTVKKEESPFKHITSSHKSKYEQIKQHHTDILEKIRTQTKDASKNSRLKIIDCFRALDDRDTNEIDDAAKNSSYTLIDVESAKDDKDGSKAENHEDYVYDIYYAKHPDMDDFCFDNLESIEPLEELIGHLPPDPEEVYETESDENDENNWRNDYPDSDVDEDDILDSIVGFRINDDKEEREEPELSTSDEDVYGDYNDTALKYGKRYAQFKAREKENEHREEDDDDDRNDYSDNDCCGIDRDFLCDADRSSEPDD